MSGANSQVGKKFYISTTPQPDDLDDHAGSGFPSLTYVQVKGMGNYGETGQNTNMLVYDTMDDAVSQKSKGITNAGDPSNDFRRIPTDPGQIAMRVAGDLTNFDAYAFKTEDQDGTVHFNRGLVTGPMRPGGGPEDFELERFTLGLVQKEVVVNPTP